VLKAMLCVCVRATFGNVVHGKGGDGRPGSKQNDDNLHELEEGK